MKIGVVVDNELNNDIRVLREIGILKEQGFDIYVLCYGFFKSYKEPVGQINITRINIPRKLRDILFFLLNTIPVYEWLWASRIKKFIISNDLEFLHVHDLYMAKPAYNLSLIHISEPTRLGMISYAVFCLKKKKKK